MRKKVTSSDVARLAGVSQTTVSFVLSDKETASISPETKARVLNAAAELGYAYPRRKISKPALTLGLMVPTLSNLYYPFLLQKIELEARSRGVQVIIMDVQRNPKIEAFYFDFIRRGIADGIIVLFTPQTKIPKEQPVLWSANIRRGLMWTRFRSTATVRATFWRSIWCSRDIGTLRIFPRRFRIPPTHESTVWTGSAIVCVRWIRKSASRF